VSLIGSVVEDGISLVSQRGFFIYDKVRDPTEMRSGEWSLEVSRQTSLAFAKVSSNLIAVYTEFASMSTMLLSATE
jgi:hypothetical protein